MFTHCVVVRLQLIFALAALAFAQTPVEFRGRVVDPAHAPMPGALVRASSETVRSTISAADGGFSLMLLPGRYNIEVIAEGFVKDTRTLDLTAPVTQEIVLQIAAVRETIRVEAGTYGVSAIASGTKTLTPLRDLPQSVTVVNQDLMRDQMMSSIGDVVRYIPGITAHQGENNRDQVIIRGNSSSADFFVDGVRDDVQYYRDLYNLERVEALKGPNAMVFGRGGGGGVSTGSPRLPVSRPSGNCRSAGGTFAERPSRPTSTSRSAGRLRSA